MEWYYVDGGQETGPVSDSAFAELAGSGKITTETLVWHEGMAEWLPFGRVADGGATGSKLKLSLKKESAEVVQSSSSASQCKNHPGVPPAARCTGCQEAFCGDCLVEIKGRNYCASCKVMALQGKQPVVPEDASIPCPEADEALKYAIIGIFCLGIVLEPMAISKAPRARAAIATLVR